MQINFLELKFEQERKSLRSQVYDLGKKLEGARQELITSKSTLSARDSELTALQNNLKELEELREMKEVLIFIYFCYFND